MPVKEIREFSLFFLCGNMLPAPVIFGQQMPHSCCGHFSALPLSHTVAASWVFPMANGIRLLLATGLILLWWAGWGEAAIKDQSRLLAEGIQAQATEQPLPPGEPQAEEMAPDDEISPDDMSLGEIPVIETMELTADIAKRALDAYILVKEKYKDAALEQYENLQDFVEQNPEGAKFEADIKAAGFANVSDWNLAITTVGFAYTGVVEDQSAEIEAQIAEIEADTELAQDMKDRMTASLRAMIPSENNRKVVQELMEDPVYLEKLKQLDTEEE
jgi:hypothetical protein